MFDSGYPDIRLHDVWIEHPQGRIFARSWEPPGAQGASPIVLLHDSLGCVALWRDFPAALCAHTGRRVIAYDRLGFGRSTARETLPAPSFVADEAAEVFPLVRQQLGLDRFVVLGHSVGGGMAVHCAAQFADHCEALITVSAQAFVEPCTIQGIEAARQMFQDAAQQQRLARYHGDKAPWVLAAWIERWLDPDFAHWSLATVLPNVYCPVLAIHGTKDPYGSTRHPQMIAQLCSGPVQLALMDEVFHVPHREQPARVLEWVAKFLAQSR